MNVQFNNPIECFKLTKKQRNFLRIHHISNDDFYGGNLFLNDCGKYLARKFDELSEKELHEQGIQVQSV